MKVRKLKFYLEDIQEEGYGSYVLYFSDQDENYYTVDSIFFDEDGDLCLQSSDDFEMTVDDLLDNLSDVDDDTYVYFEHLCWDDSSLTCDIEGGWYIDDLDDPIMDVCYHDEDDGD